MAASSTSIAAGEFVAAISVVKSVDAGEGGLTEDSGRRERGEFVLRRSEPPAYPTNCVIAEA